MYQKLIIAGNVGNKPELRYTPQGDAVTSFSVATNRKWKTKDGQVGEETCWFRVSAWGRLAENCDKYLNKGSLVLVEGALTPDKETGGPRIWTRPDGNPGSSYEIRAVTVTFLSGNSNKADWDSGKAKVEQKPLTDVNEDEIPF
jgi:single-strand DNA-binding protein